LKILKKEIIIFFAFTIYLFLFSFNTFGQTDSLPNYISYQDKLGIFVYGISKFSNFDIKGTELSQSVEYSPNNNLNLGGGFHYKWMSLAAAVNFGFINNSDNSLYGNTKSFDIQFESYLKKYLLSGNFQVYQGYYWKNPDDFFNNWSTQDSLIIKPGMSTLNLALNAIHVFNYEKFSLRAAYIGTDRQLVSCGTWLIGGKSSIYTVAEDTSLVPRVLRQYYPNASNIAQLTAINIGGALGYSHTFVFKEYYFTNITFMLGINGQLVSVNNESGENIGVDSKFGTNASMRFAIGYNNDKKYYGISVNVESYVVKNPNETQLSYNYGKFRIYYGRRFIIK
jgi:hypothetical protein